VACWSIQPFGHNRYGPKSGGYGPCYGELGPHLTVSPGLRPIFVPCGILIHPAVWPQQTWAENWAAVPPFGGGELGPHLTQCVVGRGLPSYQVASWSKQPFGYNRHGPKSGGLVCPLFGEGEMGPHLTVWPYLYTKWHLDPSSRFATTDMGQKLIHPTIWPQYTNVTDRTDRWTTVGWHRVNSFTKVRAMKLNK